MQKLKLKPTAQRLIIAQLNHCFDKKRLHLPELAKFMDIEISAFRRAIKQLEELGLAKRYCGTGRDAHKVFLRWNMRNSDLWCYSYHLMRNPLIEHYNIVFPENMDQFTPGGLDLLAKRAGGFKSFDKPHLIYKGFSQSRKKNEALIRRIRPSEAGFVAEFWAYPPILPGRTEMDDISLILSTDLPETGIEAAHNRLLAKFDWTDHLEWN